MSSASSTPNPFLLDNIYLLNNRIVLEVNGADSISFLQGLTTNNMEQLIPSVVDEQETPLIYTAFLNAQGRYLTDAFVLMPAPQQDAAPHVKGEAQEEGSSPAVIPTLWLDIEKAHADVFIKKLTLYKLRSKVQLTLRPDIQIAVSSSSMRRSAQATVPQPLHTYIYKDPRHPSLGMRYYLVCAASVQVEASAPEQAGREKLPAFDGFQLFDPHHSNLVYKDALIQALAPDGADVIAYERGFIMEFGFNDLHAIDFTKGCYIGQELTARMHYRKLGKRELVFFKLADLCLAGGGQAAEACRPKKGDALFLQDALMGEVVDVGATLALAHVRSAFLEEAVHKILTPMRMDISEDANLKLVPSDTPLLTSDTPTLPTREACSFAISIRLQSVPGVPDADRAAAVESVGEMCPAYFFSTLYRRVSL